MRPDISKIRSAVTEEPIRPEDLLDAVGDPSYGATLLFVGVVRNHNEGCPVSGLLYEAYREMAEEVLQGIAIEALDRLGEGKIAVSHRIGELSIGDTSVAIAVSSPHRAESYEASRYIIEEIKRRLPVWKEEHYVGGRSGWVAGVQPVATQSDLPREESV